jgi:hypothetical protein
MRTKMTNADDSKTRDASRVHGLEPVTVFSGENGAQVIGVIKDISGTGAHIRLVDAEKLPERVFLSSPTIGEKRSVLIRWRDETNIGVHFDEALPD